MVRLLTALSLAAMVAVSLPAFAQYDMGQGYIEAPQTPAPMGPQQPMPPGMAMDVNPSAMPGQAVPMMQPMPGYQAPAEAGRIARGSHRPGGQVAPADGIPQQTRGPRMKRITKTHADNGAGGPQQMCGPMPVPCGPPVCMPAPAPLAFY